MRRSVKWLWRIFLTGLLLFIFLTVGMYYNWFHTMPPISQIENPSSALSSEVYAADGSVIGRYFVQDRSNSKYEDISPYVFNALIATEDERFYDHSGIDGKSMLRALRGFGQDGGGSTITQQLALNLYNGERSHNKLVRLGQKVKEWVLAVKLERNLTKNEIITLYLNTVPFGDNVYGIKNASLTFFNKLPAKLSLEEAAMLVGMLKGNSYYSPRRHPDRALARRNTVIEQMLRNNKLTEAEAISYKAKPLKLDYHKLDYHEGIAPYFRQVVEAEVKKICKDLKKSDGSNYDIYRDGLRIYTTIDPKMQRYAEEAVEQHIKAIQPLFMSQSGYKDFSIWKRDKDTRAALDRAIKNSDRYAAMKEDSLTDAQIMAEFAKPVKMRVFAWNAQNYRDTTMSPIDSIKYTRMFLQAGFMAMDPYTGEVKAWVGGVNHDFFQYDHVNINTKRQVGSTIKPLLYCLAVDNGFSPCSSVQTTAQVFNGKPYNAGGSKFGSMPMKTALAKSINNAALYLIKQVGIPSFVDFVHRCGITSNIVSFPSIALGVSDISLYEMLGAYTMFPSGGMNTQPYFITKIEDKNGNLLKSFAPKQKEIINAQTAFKMVKLMRGVVDFGTGSRMRRLYGIKAEIAGKTGTTNSQADGWFIGYTPQILAGAWVGCEDRFLSFRSEALGQGAAAALPIWAYFYKRIAADKSLGIRADATFEPPKDFDDCDVSDPNSQARSGINNAATGSQEDDENSANGDKDPSATNEWEQAAGQQDQSQNPQ